MRLRTSKPASGGVLKVIASRMDVFARCVRSRFFAQSKESPERRRSVLSRRVPSHSPALSAARSDAVSRSSLCVPPVAHQHVHWRFRVGARPRPAIMRFGDPRRTRRYSQHVCLSHSVLTHGLRQAHVWLIFNVRQWRPSDTLTS